MSRLRWLLLALASLLSTAPVLANGLMTTDSSTATIAPSSVEITTSVRDQVATTVMRQTFVNRSGAALRLRFVYPLGASATVTGVRYWQHGELRVATMTGRPQDSTIYDTLPGGDLPDRALLGYLGSSPFIFPFVEALAADSSIVIELTTVELLRYAGGKVRMHVPLDMRAVGGAAFDLAIRFALESGRDITSFAATGIEMLERVGTRSCVAEAVIPGFAADRNVELVYGLAQSDLGVTLMSNKPDTSDGYFLMLAEPDPETSQEFVIEKCFTFVIDCSGSMMGAKMDQAKAAARYTIEHLNPGDLFNVIRFSSNSQRLFSEPVRATLDNIARGVAYIEALNAEGGTNIQEALLLALSQPIPDSTANIIIFVTDGIAQVDLPRIAEANTRGTRIYVFGIGSDVNRSMLTTLADGNRGLAEFLGAGDVTSRVAAFYDKIRSPMLKNVAITFDGGEVTEIYPMRLPDIYVGEQLVLLGRYRRPGPATATVRGQGESGEVALDYPVRFTGDSLVDRFIPKMWARYKIDALLVLMSGVTQASPQWREWRQEIIRLSLAYGILSPFSSFGDPGSGGGNDGGGGNGGGGNGGGGASAVELEWRSDAAGDNRAALAIAPNPVRDAARISWRVDGVAQRVRLELYDAAGRTIVELLDEVQLAGSHELTWSAGSLPAGVYLLVVDIGGVTTMMPLVVA